MPTWKKIIVIVALLLAITAGGIYGVPIVIDLVGRGVKLSETNVIEGPDDPDDLTIEDDPDKLTYDAGEILGRPVTKDAYSAARMVRSEEPDANDFTKECLVHVAINDARRKGVSLFRILTLSSNPARTGYYGKQTSRRYSTRSDPYERDLQLAEKAIAEHGAHDPTAGAWKFYHKQLRDLVNVASYETVVEDWGREGARPFTIDGTAARLVFFNSTGVA
jgi:hypothetical protein